jgi:hypothetical protein
LCWYQVLNKKEFLEELNHYWLLMQYLCHGVSLSWNMMFLLPSNGGLCVSDVEFLDSNTRGVRLEFCALCMTDLKA